MKSYYLCSFLFLSLSLSSVEKCSNPFANKSAVLEPPTAIGLQQVLGTDASSYQLQMQCAPVKGAQSYYLLYRVGADTLAILPMAAQISQLLLPKAHVRRRISVEMASVSANGEKSSIKMQSFIFMDSLLIMEPRPDYASADSVVVTDIVFSTLDSVVVTDIVFLTTNATGPIVDNEKDEICGYNSKKKEMLVSPPPTNRSDITALMGTGLTWYQWCTSQEFIACVCESEDEQKSIQKCSDKYCLVLVALE